MIDLLDRLFEVGNTEWPLFYHGTPSGKIGDGKFGVHVGTRLAAKRALEARIGVPADGDWDGTREYGRTLIAGKKTLGRIDPRGFNITGINCDAPDEDYYPRGFAGYSDRTPIDLRARPNILRVRVVGRMSNDPSNPMSDAKANGLMRSMLRSGRARSGYYYINVGEDEGSVSAVVPNETFLEVIDS